MYSYSTHAYMSTHLHMYIQCLWRLMWALGWLVEARRLSYRVGTAVEREGLCSTVRTLFLPSLQQRCAPTMHAYIRTYVHADMPMYIQYIHTYVHLLKHMNLINMMFIYIYVHMYVCVLKPLITNSLNSGIFYIRNCFWVSRKIVCV